MAILAMSARWSVSDGPKEGNATAATAFPMFVLPAARVLALDRIPTHEAFRSELVEWRPDMVVLFVSQTWLARNHPDNAENAKLVLLQRFLRDAAAGKKSILPSGETEFQWGRKMRIAAKRLQTIKWVWLDLWSVPQQDPAMQADAIMSIPTYVARSSYFIVCCPGACVHENGSVRDVRAWTSRGWCRAELLCNVLSPSSKPVILIQSAGDVQTYGPAGLAGRDWITHPVGLAEFSVDADRKSLGSVIERIVDERMAARRAEDTEEGWRWFRFLHAIKAWLLVGTDVEVAAEPTLAAWMDR